MDIEDLTNAINMTPYSSEAYINRGAEYFRQKKYDEAKNDFEKALELDPASATAYYNRALCYYNKDRDCQLALIDLNKAIEQKDNFEHAIEFRGRVHLQIEKYDDAIADFTDAIAINPNCSSYYINRAYSYIKGFNLYRLAIEDYSEALNLNPDNGMIYMNRGSAYADGLNDYEKAINDFKKALEINPNDADSHLGLGLTYIKMGRKEDAQLSWKRAYDLGSEKLKKFIEKSVYKRYS